MKVLMFFTIFLAVGAQAKVTERWICKDANSASWTTIVTADVLELKYSGVVKVAGVEHQAQYQVKGFNRRWDFGLTKNDTFDYALVIKPNGEGSYIDFSLAVAGETVKPSQFLTCQQSNLKN